MAVKKPKNATTGEPNTMRRIIKGYERHVGELEIQLEAERQRASDLADLLHGAHSKASHYEAAWLKAARQLSDQIQVNQRNDESSDFVQSTLRRDRDDARQESAAKDTEIKALKEENACLRGKAVDADMLKGAVNALRRVIVEALRG